MKRQPLLLILFIFCSAALNAQWKSLGSGIDASPRHIFTMHAVNDQVIWAATGFEHVSFAPSFEFTRSIDGGQTWLPGRLQFDPDLYHFDLFALDAQTAWVTTADEKEPISGKIYKTTDGGDTWVHQSTAFTGFNETPAAIYFWDADTGVSFGATCGDAHNDQIAIYTTDDGGEQWSRVPVENMPEQLPGEGICWWSGNSNYAAIGDTIWFFTSANRIFRSTDRGRNWEFFLVRLNNAISIAFKDAQNGILIGFYPNRAARTTDGGRSWYPIVIPSDVRASEITYVPGTAGTYLIQDGDVLGDRDMLVSYDDGESWELKTSNVNLSCLEFLSPTVGFAGGEIQGPEAGGLYRWEGNLLAGTVGINGSDLSNTTPPFKLFPIPARHEINISFPEGGEHLLGIEILDIHGRTLRRGEVLNGNPLKIDEIPAGTYLLKIRQNQRSYFRKFIKE